MSDFHIDKRQVRRNFGRAARTYEQHDALQREVQNVLLERLDFYLEAPERVIDVMARGDQQFGRGAADGTTAAGDDRHLAVIAHLPARHAVTSDSLRPSA